MASVDALPLLTDEKLDLMEQLEEKERQDIMDFESTGSNSDFESFSEYTARQEQKRLKKNRDVRMENIDATSQVDETSSNIKSKKGFRWGTATQIGVNLFAILFLTTAALGGILELFQSRRRSNMSNASVDSETAATTAAEDFDWGLAREAAALAFLTTWQAIRLWSRLIISILVPTSYATFSITKDGWVALQPSLKLSWEWILNSPPIVKGALIGAIVLLSASLYMYHEIRRRKYVERIAAKFYLASDYVGYRYEKVAIKVGKRSRILAASLPHLLFFSLAGVLYVVGGEIVTGFGKGVGGWFFVIGLPVVLSTRALVVYDDLYLKRVVNGVEKKSSVRHRRPSVLPKSAGLTDDDDFSNNGILSKAKNIINVIKQPIVQALSPTKDDNDSTSLFSEGEEMKPFIANAKRYKTMRGVRPLQYPKYLDSDESSLEQYNELSGVLYWLRYWTILAVALTFEQLPITGHLLGFLPLWPNIRLVFALWLQVPGTNGADLSFHFVVPIIGKYFQRIELPASSSTSSNFMLKAIMSQLPLAESTKIYVSEIAETGGSLLISSLPFFFMPSFVITVGCVLFGLAKPMYSAIVSVLSVEAAVYNIKKKSKNIRVDKMSPKSRFLRNLSKRNEGIKLPGASLHCTQWLEYWVVYTSFMFVHGLLSIFLFWMPLWGQIQLFLVLWLQLPYFRGARRVFKAALTIYYRVRRILFKEVVHNEVVSTGTWALQTPVHEREQSEKKYDYSDPVSASVDYGALAETAIVKKLSTDEDMFENLEAIDELEETNEPEKIHNDSPNSRSSRKSRRSHSPIKLDPNIKDPDEKILSDAGGRPNRSVWWWPTAWKS